jgi:hypothetical protein
MVHHGDEGRALAFKVGWQQGQEMIVGKGSEKRFEAALGVAQVKVKIANKVAAGHTSGGTTAGEHGLRLPCSRLHGVCFEKRNGKKGNVFQRFNSIWVNREVVDEAFVEGIVLRLKAKQFQSNIREGMVVYGV